MASGSYHLSEMGTDGIRDAQVCVFGYSKPSVRLERLSFPESFIGMHIPFLHAVHHPESFRAARMCCRIFRSVRFTSASHAS